MPDSTKITPRLDHAVETLRRERDEHDKHVARETDVMARENQSRFNRLEALIAESLKNLASKIDANTHLTGEILLQTTKTNGRVTALEKTVGEDETKGLRGGMASLMTDRTRALQTIALLATIGGLLWLFVGDEIKARGIINRPPAEMETAAEAVIEKRVQPSALKPKP